MVDHFKNTAGVPRNSSPRSRGDRGGAWNVNRLSVARTSQAWTKRRMISGSRFAFHHPPSIPP